MYLPDLIRKGAEMTLPGTGAYYKPSTDEACVIGAAAVGLKGKEKCKTIANEEVIGITGVCIDEGTPLPNGKHLSRDHALTAVLVDLNDDTDLSREAIAEWLEEEVSDEKLYVGDPSEDGDEEEEEDRELQPA
jgi:hypothetical protein